MSFPFLGGRRLVLAGMERGWIWILAGAIALGLILTLYRYERKLVSRRTGLTLLAMRVAAAIALTVALFEPIAEQTFRDTLRGRVIVGVDLSESMSTADAERSPENRDGLAKALNLSPSEPAASLTRREVARRLIQGGWRKSLDADHDVELVGFARDSTPATADILNDLMKGPVNEDDYAARTTDWVPVLERALKSPDGAPVLGVVLLTDGRANGTTDDATTITRLKERGIPVYPVLVGSTAPPRDAAIAAIKAPEAVDREQTAKVEVTVKADGMPEGLEIPVTLERPNGSPIRKTVRAQAGGGRPVVSFSVPMETTGEQSLSVAIGPIDDDDARPDNDRRSFKINVVDDKARVLLVDGEARWEFQYLRNALMRDPRVTLDAVLFHQPPSASSTEGFYPAALPARPDDPKLADPLGMYDLIIVGDVSREDMNLDAWKRLDDYVSRRGGTLVLSSGPKSWPGPLPEESTVRTLLPVTDLRLVPVDPAAIDPTRPSLPAGSTILPTATAAKGAWPMLQFADDSEASLTVWRGLPRLPWVVVGKAKPTATVLAASQDSGATEGESAAIAAMPYGLGKVLWVGTDATWRWRFRVGDAYHHRFWGQAVQWAARGKLAAGNGLVQFGPVSPRVTDGDAALLRARFADNAPNVRPDLLVAARVYRRPAKPADGPEVLGDPVAIVPLRPKADQPRVFEASAPTLAPGPYIVKLDVPQLADAMKAEGPEPRASLDVLPRETSERIELSANRDPLDRLASATGGKVVADADANTLTDLLHSRVVTKTRVESSRIWDRPEALLIFFGLLTVEWVVRKRSGLP